MIALLTTLELHLFCTNPLIWSCCIILFRISPRRWRVFSSTATSRHSLCCWCHVCWLVWQACWVRAPWTTCCSMGKKGINSLSPGKKKTLNSNVPMRKKLATVTAHRELTVSSRWPKWSQPAVTEPWPGPWLSCDLAVTELWPLLAVTEPWSLGLELWPPWSLWAHRDNFFLMGVHLNHNVGIYIMSIQVNIAVGCMPEDLCDGKWTLIQVMAWWHQAPSHYLSQCWLTYMLWYGVIRPQLINLGMTYLVCV